MAYWPGMDDLQAKYKTHVMAWKKTGKILDAMRAKEIRDTDTQEALAILADAFDSAQHLFQPDSSSGLVKLQAHLKKMRS